MDFTHYSDQAVGVATDLVNSLGSITGNEYLPDVDSLRTFLEEHGLEPDGTVTEDDLREVRTLRGRLHSVFEAPDEATTVGILNELLAEAGTLPQVTNHDGKRWHLHYVSSAAPIAERLKAVTAMGLATVLCEFGKERLGMCAADACRDVFVDMSRNRSRRYCNETCSSRMNVAAYRARRRTAKPRSGAGA